MAGENADDPLMASYRAARYRVHAPDQDIELQLGSANDAMTRLCVARKASSWAIITAHNPHSEILSDEENQRRHARLVQEVEALGLAYLPSTAGAPIDAASSGDHGLAGADVESGEALATWPDEIGLCVFGLRVDQARLLGLAHRQRAILCGELSGVTTLVDLAQDEPSTQ